MDVKNHIVEPLITHIPFDNFIFSLLNDDDDCFLNIIMNHYIEISFESVGDDFFYSFKNNYPWNGYEGIKYSFIPRIILEANQIEYTNLILSYINQGFNVLCYVNEYYIKAYSLRYQKRHVSHEIMLYGFDLEKQLFYVKDFFDLYTYSENIVTFSELTDSFLNYHKTMNTMDTGIIAIKKNENYAYHFSPETFQLHLKNFNNISVRNTNAIFNINIFDTLYEYLSNEHNYDPRCIRVFFNLIKEHTVLMQRRCMYLKSLYPNPEFDSILTKYEEIKNDTMLGRNFFIRKEIRSRNMMLPKTEDLKKYCLAIKQLKEDYSNLIKKIIYLCDAMK
ncbi:MAG: hypothetical protein K0R50_4034 [Eubacterium sp.]|jgi:hypothetical protein|nr:hypothetical protein [Eubacterium sp.]